MSCVIKKYIIPTVFGVAIIFSECKQGSKHWLSMIEIKARVHKHSSSRMGYLMVQKKASISTTHEVQGKLIKNWFLLKILINRVWFNFIQSFCVNALPLIRSHNSFRKIEPQPSWKQAIRFFSWTFQKVSYWISIFRFSGFLSHFHWFNLLSSL